MSSLFVNTLISSAEQVVEEFFDLLASFVEILADLLSCSLLTSFVILIVGRFLFVFDSSNDMSQLLLVPLGELMVILLFDRQVLNVVALAPVELSIVA